MIRLLTRHPERSILKIRKLSCKYPAGGQASELGGTTPTKENACARPASGPPTPPPGGDDLSLTRQAGSGGTATGVTSSSVSLSWTAPSGTASGYNVYQNGTQVSSVTGTSATIFGLAASTTYTFTVAAFNAAGTGAAVRAGAGHHVRAAAAAAATSRSRRTRT